MNNMRASQTLNLKQIHEHTCAAYPVVSSHNRMVLSRLAEIMWSPSFMNATEETLWSWPVWKQRGQSENYLKCKTCIRGMFLKIWRLFSIMTQNQKMLFKVRVTSPPSAATGKTCVLEGVKRILIPCGTQVFLKERHAS